MRRQRTGRIAGMDAGFLDMLQDAGDERVLAVGETIDVDLDRVGKIAIDQKRPSFRHGNLGGPVDVSVEPRDVAIKLRAVIDDLHGAAAEHVRWPNDDWITDTFRGRARL